MGPDEIRRRSRWIMRAQEWDEPRARYPNVWQRGLPVHVFAFHTVASRMRLGDLVAVYYPGSQRHPERSERYLGICRVAGLRRSHDPAYDWVDLESAHRFEPPLDLGTAPRRVVLCCDPGWPDRDVELFRKIHAAAVAAGWKPAREETEAEVEPRPAPAPVETTEPRPAESRVTETAPQPRPAREGTEVPSEPEATSSGADVTEEPEEKHAGDEGESARLFAGASYSGKMRDPREGSWLAVVAQEQNGLRLVRLEATGRSGLRRLLRNPDRTLMQAEAVGLGFPFSLPVAFAESLLGGSFPEEGWWALARKIERTSLPDYLIRLQEFREKHGELKRRTDEAARAPSPLQRSGADRASMAYHGIKMMAEERSRYVVRPFESARGKLLLEVYPGSDVGEGADGEGPLAALEGADRFPVVLDPPGRRTCLGCPEALAAVAAARCAAVAVLTGESEKSPEALSPADTDRVSKEGWVYGAAPET